MSEPRPQSENDVATQLSIDLRVTRKKFSFRARATLELSGISVVFGPSGCGKTTLLRSLAGLEQKCRGEIRWGSTVWQDAGTFVLPERRGVGYVFQEAALFPDRSAMDNLVYAQSRAHGSLGVSLERAIEACGISHLLGRKPSALSGGERQRVALARALLSRPRLLLMDEPLSALDGAGKRAVLDELIRIQREYSLPMVYVTHSMSELARLGDRVLLFEKGNLSKVCSPADVMATTALYEQGAPDVLSRLDGRVESYDEHDRIASLRCGNETILVPAIERPKNDWARLVLSARDIALSLEQSSCSSVLNCLPAVVARLSESEHGAVLVSLQTESGELSASITKLAQRRLSLKVGSRCFAQLKATSLRLS